METRLAALCTLVFAGTLVTCRDSANAPRAATAAPQATFSLASDSVPGPGPGNQAHFVSNGDFGNISWSGPRSATASDSGPGPGTFGSLFVSRGGPINAPQTFLSYFIQQCDAFFNCVFFRGSGLIPNSDLSGGGKSLQLSTNTTGNQNFFTFAGPTGLVSVNWTVNGFFQASSSGTSQQSFPGFTFRSTGVSTFASANATGSVVGMPILPNNSGGIGSNLSVTIDIFH
jgi:hypothetical protein